MIKSGLKTQAENLSISYYMTLSMRKDNKEDLLKNLDQNSEISKRTALSLLSNRTVPNVGVVLDGNWVSTSGTTSCLLQDYGWQYMNFNAMNGTAPDAYSTTLPTGAQFLGTLDPKRLQAFTFPYIQYGVADATTGTTYYTQSVPLQYCAHVQDIGWQNYVSSPSMAGTTEAKRIEAIKIKGPSYQTSYLLAFNDPAPSTKARMFIYYRAHIQDYGWTNWASEDLICGTTGQHKRLQGMQVRVYLVKV